MTSSLHLPDDDARGGRPILVGPLVMLSGMLSWFVGMSPAGKAWLGFSPGRGAGSVWAENPVFLAYLGGCMALVLVGVVVTLRTPTMGRRPRNDPDWRAFFRARNRAAGLLLLSGVPLSLGGVVILVVLVVVGLGLVGSGDPWGPDDLLQLIAALVWLVLGALTMWRSWLLMQEVPWERQSDEPLPLDPGGADPVEPAPPDPLTR